MSETLLTKKEVAERCRVTTRTVEIWTHQGLRSLKIGRCRRYRQEDLQAWLNAHVDGD